MAERIVRAGAHHMSARMFMLAAPASSPPRPGRKQASGVEGSFTASRRRCARLRDPRSLAVAVFTLDDYASPPGSVSAETSMRDALRSSGRGAGQHPRPVGTSPAGITDRSRAARRGSAEDAQDHVVITEDTREPQCAAPNLVVISTQPGCSVATSPDLVRSSRCARPDRIPIGEVRSGALDLLKVAPWAPAIPAASRAIHAGNLHRVLRRRPQQLIQEAVVADVTVRRSPRRSTSWPSSPAAAPRAGSPNSSVSAEGLARTMGIARHPLPASSPPAQMTVLITVPAASVAPFDYADCYRLVTISVSLPPLSSGSSCRGSAAPENRLKLIEGPA